MNLLTRNNNIAAELTRIKCSISMSDWYFFVSPGSASFVSATSLMLTLVRLSKSLIRTFSSCVGRQISEKYTPESYEGL